MFYNSFQQFSLYTRTGLIYIIFDYVCTCLRNSKKITAFSIVVGVHSIIIKV